MKVTPKSAAELAAPERLHSAWMGSPGHSEHLARPDMIAVTAVTDGQLPSAYFVRVRSYLQ